MAIKNTDFQVNNFVLNCFKNVWKFLVLSKLNKSKGEKEVEIERGWEREK